ncbi:hypothetical protein QTI17_17115 [Variovorax sp. J31P179]|jgi:hypothetical protein|uniref:hypothetical protein n=1 Tax=Variovorax sp. J31P179 TaxID=3053508 RepID=UPI002574F704|nr:hypothetical protein [Variovorax sp. J31P179]MDM0082315.1 hypothetical protein [Variovorax sp. J31P179]
MNAMTPQTWTLVAIVAAVIVIALAAYAIRRSKESQGLRTRFGPEYDRAVQAHGSRAQAEAELRRREERVGHLTIVPLAAADAARFSAAWTSLQADFVDNPRGVVDQADALVRELLAKRGYPVTDFEHRAADISVDHPTVVSNYRAAQEIRGRTLRGEVETEELRKAVVHYRALFDELLEVRGLRPEARPQPSIRPTRPMEVRS